MKKIAISLSLLATLLLADEQNIQKTAEQSVRDILPNAPISKVEQSDIPNIYKAYMPNGQILYIEPNTKIIIVGEMVKPNGYSITQKDSMEWQKELQSKQIANLTPEKLTKDSLKIEFGKGSKKYEFAIFTDPECPYCRKAEEVFNDKNVTVYVNFMPLDFHQNAKPWSLDILSSKNPKQTASDIKHDIYKKYEHTKEANNQLEKMIALAKELNITGTPKLFIIDKVEKKVIDVINGADVAKMKKYLD
ncbi:MAG: DsbC family protein [Arcobacteraceae bacterium]|nr:DsbC family protein [Arcobacteraceae bacterium]